jgi:hypothetical protein
VGAAARERRRWPDLGSLIELRLGERLAGVRFDDACRVVPARERGHRQRRVGTLALGWGFFAGRLLEPSSLCVAPRYRRGGARRALDRVHDASRATGIRGVRFTTAWRWQAAAGSW